MNNYRLTALSAILLGAVFLACGGGGDTETAAKAPAAAPAPATGNSSVKGVVSYTNGDPDTAINMNADPFCLGEHTEPVTTETLVAQDGKLSNVFVYVKEGLTGSYSPPAEKKILDQQGCTYHPHVSGMMTNQTLVVRNSDDTMHNVHAIPTKNEEFNKGQPFANMEFDHEFTTPEVMVRFKCDVHPWMGAYVGVLDHPFFAVTGADGTFDLKGLPAGDYEIEAWHETLGTQSQSVSVSADGSADVAFEFAPKAS